jgi:rhamnulokinase
VNKLFGAIDLGASSGRIIAGIFGPNTVTLQEIHRFANGPLEEGKSIYWDFSLIQSEIRTGLEKLADFADEIGIEITSLGIDTWAVDYGLLDEMGELISQPRCYRDERNLLGASSVDMIVDAKTQFEHNGLQYQTFNTLYQLAANKSQDGDNWARAETMLLIPDLLTHWLTGVIATERTNASTTGLLNVHTHEWDWDLIGKVGYKKNLFTRLVDSGTIIGPLLPPFSNHPKLRNTVVTTVPSHDTAAAVVGTPLRNSAEAFLSSGTWSLIGLELTAPVIDTAALNHNFTNELGVEGKVRFLKNISGLWLLQQALAEWKLETPDLKLQSLLEEASGINSDARVNVNAEEFATPGGMPGKIQTHCSRLGTSIPKSRAEIVRCILDSLADAYSSAIAELESITGIKIERINIVGGGSQNALLAQLTSNATGVEVRTGPVEATALGNLVSQASAHGSAPNSLSRVRAFLLDKFEQKIFFPAN